MTERAKRNLEIAGTILAIGIAWGLMTATVSGKVDYSSFKADSIEVRSEIRSILKAVNETNAALTETNSRLKELVCEGRPGCR